MKFKKFPCDEPARILTITDKEGIDLDVFSFSEKGNYDVMFVVDGSEFGTSRKKALKLAWSIIDELDESVLTR